MTDDVSLLRMIARIYDAATEPSGFAELAPDLARTFAGDFSLLYVMQDPTGRRPDVLLSGTPEFDDWAHSSYTGYYRQRDIWGLEIAKTVTNGVVHGHEAVDPGTLHRSEIYTDWYRKVGVHHALAGVFSLQGETGFVSVTRPQPRAEFDESEKARLGLLLPHIQRAVQIHRRLSAAEHQRTMTFEMLERLALGIIIVETDARIMFVNSVAQRVLQLGRDMTVVQGRLRLRNEKPKRNFEKTVRDAAWTSIGRGTSPGGIVAVPRPEGLPLSLLISPYRSPLASDPQVHGTALIIFSNPEARADVPERLLTQMLGVSPAEGRLITALVAGQSINEYAEAVGVSKNTVKTQMRQIFNKTGYNRYSDIVRAVAANPLLKFLDEGDPSS
jgi:DNA-binding CsgD family transcriptional regulator/PAS domain-containing protein